MSKAPAQITPLVNLARMAEYGPLYAQAKANRVHLEEYRKSLKAMLMGRSDAKTIGDREAEAYAHPEYIAHLEGLKAAVEAEESARWALTLAQTAIEVWRSQEASNRNMDRAAA